MKKILFSLGLLLITFSVFSQTYRPNNVPTEFNFAIRFTSDITPTSLSASQNNYDPAGFTGAPDTAIIIRQASSAAVNITGLAAGTDGRYVLWINTGSFPQTFKNQSSSSTAANRFISSGDVTLQPNDIAELYYDNTTARWRIITNRLQGEQMLGRVIGANLNVTTDQAIAIYNASKFVITKIVVTNASADISGGTTAGGVYPTTAKGGTPIVAAGQVYTALSASTKYVALTLAAVTNTDAYTVSNIYLSLTTAFGSACTADVYVYGYVLEQ